MNIRGQDTIPLVDKKNSNTNTNSTACHKNKDVVFSRENIPGIKSKTFRMNMYRMDNCKLRMYPLGTSANAVTTKRPTNGQMIQL
jgi:hypothetical protein